MGCKFVCDGCGKEEGSPLCMSGKFIKPHDWFIRGDDDGPQVACCRECIKTISEKTGKTDIVLPL